MADFTCKNVKLSSKCRKYIIVKSIFEKSEIFLFFTRLYNKGK